MSFQGANLPSPQFFQSLHLLTNISGKAPENIEKNGLEDHWMSVSGMRIFRFKPEFRCFSWPKFMLFYLFSSHFGVFLHNFMTLSRFFHHFDMKVHSHAYCLYFVLTWWVTYNYWVASVIELDSPVLSAGSKWGITPLLWRTAWMWNELFKLSYRSCLAACHCNWHTVECV